MASRDIALEINQPGEFFVDSTCINCDTCRQLAPSTFSESQGYSYVIKQPENTAEIKDTMEAVIACPTGSIGHTDTYDRRKYRNAFPKKLDDNLYYLGYHSPKSYGGASYLLLHQEGNWMIDAPRYSTYLRDEIEKLGGIDYIFLTHQDDVADAEKYAKYFNCKRIIHHYDKSAAPSSEIIIEGKNEIEFQDQIIIIPTPGHTKGHMSLLAYDRYLFTGDHMNWNREWQGLRSSRRMNWYSWKIQKQSIKLLKEYNFQWVLPGHGQRKYLPEKRMEQELDILIEKIEEPNYW